MWSNTDFAPRAAVAAGTQPIDPSATRGHKQTTPLGCSALRCGLVALALTLSQGCVALVLVHKPALAAVETPRVGRIVIDDPPPGLDRAGLRTARAAKSAAENCDSKRFLEIVAQAGFKWGDDLWIDTGFETDFALYLKRIARRLRQCERFSIGKTTFIVGNIKAGYWLREAGHSVNAGLTVNAIGHLRQGLNETASDATRLEKEVAGTSTDDPSYSQTLLNLTQTRTDAATLQALIDSLSVSLPPPPPRTGPISPPGRLRFAMGPTGSEAQVGLASIFGAEGRARFGTGTTFNVTLGREVPILFSPRNLTFAGGAAEFRAPASALFGADVPSLFSQVAFYGMVDGRSFWGSDSATVPIGAANVAYTYLFPNPATGTTGVLAGASGQDIGIKVNGEAIRARAGVEIRMPSLPELRAMYSVITGGIAFDYTDTGYEITQQSLVFSNVSSRTKLVIDDYFVAPYFGARVGFDDGNVFASIGGFVAPGFVITDASAKQQSLCGPCPNPGDRNVALSRSFSNTRFSVQTGLDLRLGARLTPSVSIEGGFQYVYTSHVGFLRPPTTPSEQPASLGYGSSNRYGGRFGVRFTF